MAGTIFISYRREDSQGSAGRLYDRLILGLDRQTVFFDVDNIVPGADFVEVLGKQVAECDVLLAIIGRRWISVVEEGGGRRLDNPNDFVRIEIQTALARGVRVIPVLVDGALMPKEADLPEPLKALARRQAVEVTHARFDADAARLVKFVSRSLEQSVDTSSRRVAGSQSQRGRIVEVRGDPSARRGTSATAADRIDTDSIKETADRKVSKAENFLNRCKKIIVSRYRTALLFVFSLCIVSLFIAIWIVNKGQWANIVAERKIDVGLTPEQPPSSRGRPPVDQDTGGDGPTRSAAQRAALLVDAPDEPQKIRTYAGTVVWHLDRMSPGQGLPLTPAIGADVDIPDAKLKVTMVMQKNLEPRLPASNTIELHFLPESGYDLGDVAQINVPDMRKDDAPAGDALAGVPVMINPGSFLVGLSRGSTEAQNRRLILERNWFDVSILFASKHPAKLTFEKGIDGQRLWEQVFAAWGDGKAAGTATP